MSRIYFHSLSKEAEVLGSERAHMGWVVDALALSVLDADVQWERIKKFIPDTSYLHRSDEYRCVKDFGTWFRVGSDDFVINGYPLEKFALSLNTACAIGNDAIKLMARIHGQCEIHCYVEGQNRNWLSGIVSFALTKNIFRQGAGWEDVISLLASTDKEPVVLSYSVTDQFPERPSSYDNSNDSWYDLSAESAWEISMKALREGEWGHGLEMKPDNWQTYYFNHGVTAFDLFADTSKQISEWLEWQNKQDA